METKRKEVQPHPRPQDSVSSDHPLATVESYLVQTQVSLHRTLSAQLFLARSGNQRRKHLLVLVITHTPPSLHESPDTQRAVGKLIINIARQPLSCR
jgi:hypothetical protein